jgi:uncharacterized membrane protein
LRSGPVGCKNVVFRFSIRIIPVVWTSRNQFVNFKRDFLILVLMWIFVFSFFALCVRGPFLLWTHYFEYVKNRYKKCVRRKF